MGRKMKKTRGGDEMETKIWKRRTDVNLVSLKRRPINPLVVQLDQDPVFGEIVGLERDLGLLGVKYEANDTLVRGGTAFGDLVVDRIHLLDLLRRLRHQSEGPSDVADAPIRARLEDTGNAAAVAVAAGVGVLISEAGRLGDDVVCGHPKKKGKVSILRDKQENARDTHFSKIVCFSDQVAFPWSGTLVDSRRTDTTRNPNGPSSSAFPASRPAQKLWGLQKGFLPGLITYHRLPLHCLNIYQHRRDGHCRDS